jgi:hypothetical protein
MTIQSSGLHVTNLSFLPVTVIPRRLYLHPYSFHHIELRFLNKTNTNHIISKGLFERRTPAQVVKFVAGRLAEVPHLFYFAACASCLTPPLLPCSIKKFNWLVKSSFSTQKKQVPATILRPWSFVFVTVEFCMSMFPYLFL